MDRLDFFAEIKKSLVDTVREISAPFVEDELKKVDRAVETFTQTHWAAVSVNESMLTDARVKEVVVLGLPIMFYKFGNQIRALHKKCDECGAFLHYISYSQQLKCMSCDKDADIVTKEGTLQLQYFQTKIENQQLYVGIPLECLKK